MMNVLEKAYRDARLYVSTEYSGVIAHARDFPPILFREVKALLTFK
jgi:hypothetical protein